MSRRSRLVLLATFIAVAAGLRLWGIRFGLPHDLARPDEEKITAAALRVARGDPDPHFFLYPSVYVYVTAASARVLGLHHDANASALRLLQRSLTAICGIATVPVLYAGAAILFGTRTALVSAAFLAVAFLHVRDSHFGVTDVPVTLLVVVALWLAARMARDGVTPRRAAISGLLCGLAASTKYNAVLIVLPTIAAVAIELHDGTIRPARALASLGWFGFAGLAAFLAGTPFALLDRPAFMEDIRTQAEVASGERHGSLFDAARAVYGGERGWQHHLDYTLRYGVGLPLLVLALASAVWLAVYRPRKAAIVLPFPLVFYLAMGGSLLVYARWMVPLVPFLCLTAASGIDALAGIARRAMRSSSRLIDVALPVALTIAVATPTAAQSVAFDRLMTRTDTRVLAAEWIERRFPQGASIYQTGVSYGHVQPRPAGRYPQGRLEATGDGPFPTVVIAIDSPLSVFNHIDEDVAPMLAAHYTWIATFNGVPTQGASAADFDQQDAFYAPYTDFKAVKRPGPSLRIFVRAPEH